MTDDVTSLGDRAPKPAGESSITMPMGGEIIFRDQAALDEYVAGALREASGGCDLAALAKVICSADDTVDMRYGLHVAQVIADTYLPAVVREAEARAWDEGYTSGHSNAMRLMSDEPYVQATSNPYRAEDR